MHEEYNIWNHFEMKIIQLKYKYSPKSIKKVNGVSVYLLNWYNLTTSTTIELT